jgi:hypothetical protein
MTPAEAAVAREARRKQLAEAEVAATEALAATESESPTI